MRLTMGKIRAKTSLLVTVLLLFLCGGAHAAIDGLTGTSFSLTAKKGTINTPDSALMYIWGYASGGGTVQYPGPTLIVKQGDNVTVTLTNELTEATSIVFPGQVVTATGGNVGLLTKEAPPDGTTVVTYTFTAGQPGTYTYYSGTHGEVQTQMGLFGALIVRPANYVEADPTTWTAYGTDSSAYDEEVLYLLSEMDFDFNQAVGTGQPADPTTFLPTIWFINGRAAPDTMAPANAAWLPTQPYNCMPMAYPGERVLLRMVGGGIHSHPLHTHGNNFELIARDGRLLDTAAADPELIPGAAVFGTVPDLAVSNFTQTVSPGSTYDAVYIWTGQDLGWDPYGSISTTCTDGNNDGLDDTTNLFCHDATCTDGNGDGFDDATFEHCAEHGVAIPVQLPAQQDLTFGQFYSGSPFLGSAVALPPGEGGFNPASGYFYMWHSHNEKELTVNDIFPGGMMSMFLVVPYGTAKPQ